jgi:hypothetical protein
VGLYTGSDKSGLRPFLERRVDVLIGSKPVGTGLDGSQMVCDRIIMVSLPWTSAEQEQIEGRVRRQGSRGVEKLGQRLGTLSKSPHLLGVLLHPLLKSSSP